MVTFCTSASDRFFSTMTQGASAVPRYATRFSPEAMGCVTVQPKAKGGL